MGGMSGARTSGPHELSCAQRLRLRALLQAGEPAEPPIALLHDVARQIRNCCGHSPLKSHRLAWGWTVNQAIQALHQMCRTERLGARGLGERSWLGWEAGGRPNDDYRDLLCRLFQTSGVQLGFAADYTPLRPTDTDSGNTRDVPSDISGPIGRIRDRPIASVPACEPEPSNEAGDPPSWRQEARTYQPASLQEEIVLAAQESARFVRRAGVAVTGEVLEQLDVDVKWLAVEYLRRPPYAVFRPLAGLRREVFELIDGHPRPEYLTDLYRVAGQLSALLAHASSDLGQPYAADSHARTAWLCADLSGDNGLRAYTRWVQSNVAYWQGEYRQAAELAHSGQRHADNGSGLLRLASQEARALAACRDEREADRALAIATDAREQVTDEARPPGVFYFAPGKAAYYASEVRLSLDGEPNFRRAVTEAEEALALFAAASEQEQSAELVAAAQLDLVAAHLALGDLDAANHHAQAVLRLPAESRTVPIVARMTKVDRTLASDEYRDSTLAAHLREEIELFHAYPAARELPLLPF